MLLRVFFTHAHGTDDDKPRSEKDTLARDKRALLEERRQLRDLLATVTPTSVLHVCRNPRLFDEAARAIRLDQIQWDLVMVSNRLRRMRRKQLNLRHNTNIATLNDHWAHRNMKEAWSVAMAECGTSPGKRYRRFDHLRTVTQESEAWEQRCCLPGPSGGCSGLSIDYQSEIDKLISMDHASADPLYRQVPTADHLAMADALLLRLGQHAPRLRLGKAIVNFSLPNEIWRLLFRPQWVFRDHRHVGIGAAKDFLVPSLLRRWLTRYVATILSVRMTPFLWHLACAFTVPKLNGLSGLDAERLVVTLCPMGRSFFQLALDYPLYYDKAGDVVTVHTAIADRKALSREAYLDAYPVSDWQFGCVPNRRREEAVAIQMIHCHQVRKLGMFFSNKCHDGVNAFWSLRREQTIEAVAPPFVFGEAEFFLLKQRLQYSVVKIGRGQRAKFVLVRDGVLPGDHSGPRVFNQTIRGAGDRILLRIKHTTEDPQALFFQCFLFPDRKFCAASTGYVDNLATKAIGRTPQQLLRNREHTDVIVAEEMLRIGIAMNKKKEEELVDGPCVADVRAIKMCTEGVVSAARYLGSRQADALGIGDELAFRVAAVKRAWGALWKLFSSAVSLRFKMVIFLCCIVGTALSGLEAYCARRAPLTRADLQPLQVLVNRYLRLLPSGGRYCPHHSC